MTKTLTRYSILYTQYLFLNEIRFTRYEILIRNFGKKELLYVSVNFSGVVRRKKYYIIELAEVIFNGKIRNYNAKRK